MSKSGARETIETISGCLLSGAFLALPILLIVAFIKSLGWIVAVVLPICNWASAIAILLVPVFLLFAIPRVTRAWAGLGITISSYVIGINLWLWALILAFAMAGLVWVIIGLIFAGVGVIVVASIAALIRGEWILLLELVGSVVIIFVLRIVGAALMTSAESSDDDEYLPPSPPTFADEDMIDEPYAD